MPTIRLQREIRAGAQLISVSFRVEVQPLEQQLVFWLGLLTSVNTGKPSQTWSQDWFVWL